MRWLINYIRQCFCIHDWITEEREVIGTWGGKISGRWFVVYMRCRKCGYHQIHKKA